MNLRDTHGPNTLFLEVSGAGLPDVDGLFVPSTAPPATSESGTVPTMLYFEYPSAVLVQRILDRAPYSGRSDDNVESITLRFDTFKAETLPTVEFFKSRNKCVEIDTSQDRQTVYALVAEQLAMYTDEAHSAIPLTERSEMLLGLRPFSRNTAARA